MLPFTFRQIEVFLEVCRAGNFRSAADQLQISQPAVSNQIRALEAQLGQELFLRRPGVSCVLSPEGLAFKDSAEQFYRQGQMLCPNKRRSAQRRRPLRVFVGGHLLEDYVRPALEQFHLRYPHLALQFLPHRSRVQLAHDIQRGRVEVALVTAHPDEPVRATRILGVVEAGVFCRADKFKSNGTAEISQIPFILPPKGTPEALKTLEILRQHGVHPTRIAATTQYHDVLVRMACEGRGAIFSIQSVVDRHDPGRKLTRVLTTEPPWERRVYVAPTVDAASARAIVDFLQKSIPTPTV